MTTTASSSSSSHGVVGGGGGAGMMVTPGMVLGKGKAGTGTYEEEDGQVRAALVGNVMVTEDGMFTVAHPRNLSDLVPFLGCEVVGKVVRVTPRVVDVQIMCVDQRPVRGTFKGTLRKENVRAFEVDLIDLYDCFRMGDIICCVVCALGGARSYELTTAQNHLGVLYAASSVTGEPMVPISWSEMKDPTMEGHVEKRKVASRMGDGRIV